MFVSHLEVSLNGTIAAYWRNPLEPTQLLHAPFQRDALEIVKGDGAPRGPLLDSSRHVLSGDAGPNSSPFLLHFSGIYFLRSLLLFS